MISALVLAACAASNPAPPSAPAAWQPKPEPAAAAPSAAQTPDKPAEAGPAPAPATAADAADPVVAHVAGRALRVSELLSQWMYSDSFAVREQLDNLAVGHLVVVEATRLGARLDPDLATTAYERGVQAIEKEIQTKRPGMSLDRYVDQVLGLDPIRYRERLRDDALRSLLGERVVRAWLLQNEHAFLRVIVVQSEAEIQAAQADLSAGKTFEEVARLRSKDASAKDGGRIAPIVRGDTPIGRLAFATDPGSVGGPVAENGAWLLARVEKRGGPVAGDWTKLGPAVEASLSDQGVDRLELEQWRKAMRERYEVDLKPFLRLVGEASR